ncbi:acetoacetate decarboxylase family protein [Hoyosella subflava]|uniref:Acetoacetate decarboxylase n=1 Tax=Hoyosella subflava (strain DSM 45089 / JCM 17490 / NBRC 109087 / DQS3-9A1) TaxID=443218 RepID=F6ER37_HOYSD|nr:acetoacetate decarboxylase family protein [Hoyosella subflava]AEF40724.1 Acetoacetate decarboxylase [Hoyosella subflava DQS3-9A1]
MNTIDGLKHAIGIAALPDRGYIYRDAHYLTAVVEIDSDKMQPWLPAGVTLTGPATADLFCAWFPDCNYGSVYHEAGLLVHIKTGIGPFATMGVHCPWMILDDDAALILGREVLGYPKKLGAIDWSIEGDAINATATRRGATLIEMRGALGDVIDDAPPILGRPHRNVVGSVLPYLVAFTPGEHVIEVRRANLDVSVGNSERDPLQDMGVGQVIESRLHRVNLSAGSPPVPIRPVLPTFTTSRLNGRIF